MNDKQLEEMRYAGYVNQQAIEAGFRVARPGVALKHVDDVVEKAILAGGLKPAFKNYQPDGYPRPFPATACISPNDVVVHGVPGDYVLKDGDILTIDVGTNNDGLFVDAARTRLVTKNGDPMDHKLIVATEAILQAQLSIIKENVSLLDLVLVSEAEANRHNVVIMPQWGGHAIGERIHMDPFIPSAIDRSKPLLTQKMEERRYARQKLTAGQTICLEPVVTFGSFDIILDDDQWTVRKADGQLAAHTERCILVTEDGYELLS